MGFYQGVHPDRGVITVKPAAADTGKPWSLVLTAGGDMYCELEGVPPYLATRADACQNKGDIPIFREKLE
jgi:hypothetical protein